MRSLTGLGLAPDARNATLDNLLTGQSVMLATNQIFWIVAAMFVISAFAIWLAPRPTRAVAMSEAGH
jgi:DHA2 family multidrug resistance protein